VAEVNAALRLRCGIVVLALSLLAVSGAAARGTELDTGFRSQALRAELHFEVYLPADYNTTSSRYPVLYFLHGLPSGATAYRDVGFLERALDATGHEAILVAPQGANANEPDAEYLDRWETAIARELVHAVDTRYRTIPTRNGRALIGLSAGGYGAMHLGLEYLRAFSVVESWSGYFKPTDPSGTQVLDLGSNAKNTQANVHEQAKRDRARLRALPTFIAFYIGRDDTRFVAENRQLNLELTEAGVPHVFRIYPGGHEHALWQRYARPWLSLALARLAPVQR
jgi:enterochelin esterase-like enzyme